MRAFRHTNGDGRDIGMFRRHFNATTALAIVALIFAMTGGAFALNGGGKGGASHASAQVAAKKKGKAKAKGIPGPRGPQGKQGPAGSAGPAGAVGAAGPKGENGAAGANGTNGEKGANGASVAVKAFTGSKEPAAKPCGGAGGNELEAEGSKVVHYACNGIEGKEGAPGAIHPGETLPKGATETGIWSFGPITVASAGIGTVRPQNVPIASFPIQLAGPLTGGEEACQKQEASCQVHVINREGKEVTNVEVTSNEVKEAGLLEQKEPKPCPGSTETPEAASGNLCIYIGELTQAALASPYVFDPATTNLAAGRSGAFGQIYISGETGASGRGSWAVTG